MQVMGTDYTFTCPTRYAVRGFVNAVKEEPVWLHVFNHSISFDAWGKNFSFCNGHSCERNNRVFFSFLKIIISYATISTLDHCRVSMRTQVHTKTTLLKMGRYCSTPMCHYWDMLVK